MIPIVFVHGIRLSGTMWGPVAALVDGPSTAPDLPGHGSRGGEPFTLDGAVEAVASAVDGPAVLVGHSLGGFVAIAAAARYPERVAALVVGGCTVRPRGAFLAGYRFAAGLAGRHPELADRLSVRGFQRALPPPVAAAMVAGGVRCAVMPSVVTALSDLDPPACLRAYPGPVHLFNGARDPFRAEERRFLAASPGAHLTIVPARGHIGVMAETETLAALVTEARRQTQKASPT
ncbi:lysophospholipase [Actinoplanes ianthinogenes]|uniref:Lysophospholipase n=1 Tax=Actinoplanes ianthinogenes TaxID=122358 RepID=A0ABM7LJZ7_9ACTN|nr:alpha/beta fold hydrolase [Actinoplanes ianthinogenes]BCJ39473.1 lysophospholipase [Actinoplanes ianthinogenes]GGR35844.1 lysophospholipase [Actinoplanes ianthinogenes]